MLNRTFRSIAIGLTLATVFALPAAPGAPNSSTDTKTVTWAKHIAPLVFENCVSCHRPGQVAPMSMLTYKEARPWAKSIRRVVNGRIMPPWFADPAHGEFVEDSRLSEEQIALITRWVAQGAPAGDLSAAPAPPTFNSEWRIGTPDVILTMEPFQVTDEMEDHYEWIKVENTLDKDRWIKEFEVRPTFMEAAHHNLTYLAPGHFTTKDIQGPGRMEMTFLGGWAPGVVPAANPDNYGQLIPANSAVFFQMHYHKTPGPGTGGTDQTSVGINFWEDVPDNKIATLWVVDPVLQIPPGEANYASGSAFEFPSDAIIFDFTPHMHLRGKAMKFTATSVEGETKTLLDVPEYDFNWQLTYTPTEPIMMPAGSRIAVNALFDNSAGNEANPDPSATVRWGEATTDEMMIGFMRYSYVDKALQDDMEVFAVPDHVKQQMMKIRELRKQRKAADQAEEEGSNSDQGQQR